MGNAQAGNRGLLSLLKPSAPRWAHYLLAALLWTGVGAFLLYRGVTAMGQLHGAALFYVAAGAGMVGLFKGLKVMRPVAVKGAERIGSRGDGKCLGGFISWKAWLMVVSMGVLGRYLRELGLPPWLMGLLLGGVGTALLIGSLTYWSALIARKECRSSRG